MCPPNAPPLQSLLDTAALSPDALALALPFPFIVWGADELRRWLVRRGDPGAPPGQEGAASIPSSSRRSSSSVASNG